MSSQTISIFISHIILPVLFLYWFAKSQYKSRTDWFVLMLMTGTYISYIFFTGRWDWLSFYWRYLFALLFIWIFFKTFQKMKSLPRTRKKLPKDVFVFAIQILIFFVFGLFLFFSFKGRFYSGEEVELQFPLRNGAYYIAQGGNSSITNFHSLGRAQKFAVDIVKMFPWGTRAKGLYPKELQKYAVYGDTVYSPTDGLIIQARDSLNDQTPSEKNPEEPAGNLIGIKNGPYHVYLAHLQHRSIMVKVGDKVKAGQPLARVGNTGYTDEPQLHIHVERGDTTAFLKGEGVVMKFNNRFLVRNDIVKQFKEKKSEHR